MMNLKCQIDTSLRRNRIIFKIPIDLESAYAGKLSKENQLRYMEFYREIYDNWLALC